MTTIDIGDAVLALFQADDDLLTEIANSDHPAAERFTDWLCRDVLPCLRRRERYVWPGTKGEFDAMLRDARRAVLADAEERAP